MRKSSRSVSSQNNNKKKSMSEATSKVKELTLAEEFGNRTDELPFSFAMIQRKYRTTYQKGQFSLFDGFKVITNMFRREIDVSRFLEANFKNIFDIKKNSEHYYHQSLKSI